MTQSIYIKSLVTFIDILGFKEMVKADPLGSAVRDAVSHLKKFGTMDLDERSYHGFSTFHFSDSVTRCTPLLDETGNNSDKALLLREIEELTYIQGELSAKGILIRGGISCGNIHIGEQEVFGPAFIDAYTLESKHANYPRIILHPKLVEKYAVIKNSGYGVYAEDDLKLTRIDSDGFHYIDYLTNFPREIHTDASLDREQTALSYMEPRKTQIEENIQQADILGTVRPKYVWLGKYHNITARELLEEQAAPVIIQNIPE
jgi:hypothetical protein